MKLDMNAIATIAADFDTSEAEIVEVMERVESLFDESGTASRSLTGDEQDVINAYNQLTIPSDVLAFS